MFLRAMPLLVLATLPLRAQEAALLEAPAAAASEPLRTAGTVGHAEGPLLTEDSPTDAASQATKEQQPLPADRERLRRTAIQRALPIIVERGQWWIEKKDCVSCHRIGNMLWTLRLAKQRGCVLPDISQDWFSWAVQSSQATDEKGVTDAEKNREGIVQLLAADRVSPFIPSEIKRAWIDMMLATQEEDGCWQPGGQLPSQKRPEAETRIVSAMWIGLALARENDARARTAVQRVLQTVDRVEGIPVSTEWYAVQLLLAQATNDADRQRDAIAALVQEQHPDGGWGWLLAEPGDALATGLALFALASTDRELTEPEMANAVQAAEGFLLSTQQFDGGWKVPGTKKNKKMPQETASYWGTCWATMGLLQSEVWADHAP
ncbi:MAG: squalene--hopene cyclase [Pirellulaceae bacterium]|nr:MAG: squalene--hopene cyclase [Pirellulaceae bacterium]